MHGSSVVEFVWDPGKDAANRSKHGIGFTEARRLWQDSGLIVLPSRFPDEKRFLAIGQIGGKHWTAIFTERGEAVRLISVRRSRESGRRLYEQTQA